MAFNLNTFISFMDTYVTPNANDGTVMPNLIVLYNDYVKRTSSDAFIHPNVFNPVVELYCKMKNYQTIKETKNRVTKLRGIALVPNAQLLANLLTNGVPGTTDFETSAKAFYTKIMERSTT